jgi:hypothetical protein
MLEPLVVEHAASVLVVVGLKASVQSWRHLRCSTVLQLERAAASQNPNPADSEPRV